MFAWKKGERESAWKKGNGSCSLGSAGAPGRCDVTNVRGNGSVSAREPVLTEARILTLGINRNRDCFLTPRPFRQNATHRHRQVTWARSRDYVSDVIEGQTGGRMENGGDQLRSSSEEDANHPNGSDVTKDTRYDTFLDLSKLNLDNDVNPSDDFIKGGDVIEVDGCNENTVTLETVDATLQNKDNGQEIKNGVSVSAHENNHEHLNKSQDNDVSNSSTNEINHSDVTQPSKTVTVKENGNHHISCDPPINKEKLNTNCVTADDKAFPETSNSFQKNVKVNANVSDCNVHTEKGMAIEKQNNTDSDPIEGDKPSSQGAKTSDRYDEMEANTLSNDSTDCGTGSADVDINTSGNHNTNQDSAANNSTTNSDPVKDTTITSSLNSGVISTPVVKSANSEDFRKMPQNNVTHQNLDLISKTDDTNLKQFGLNSDVNGNDSIGFELKNGSSHNGLHSEISKVNEEAEFNETIETSDPIHNEDDLPTSPEADSQSGSSILTNEDSEPFKFEFMSPKDKTLSLDRNAFKCQEIPLFSKDKNKKEMEDKAALHSGMKRLYQITLSSVTSKEKTFAKIKDLFDLIESKGIRLSDPRLKESFRKIEVEPQGSDTALTFDVFSRTCEPSFKFIRSILLSQLSVPGFSIFKLRMERIFEVVKVLLDELKVEPSKSVEPCSSYNVMMRRQKQSDSSNLSFSVCTVDGQRLSFGDKETPHPLNSCASVFNFCLGCRQNGSEKVSSYVGSEAKPADKDEFSFNEQSRVWNPFTKAGSIITTTLLFQQMMVEKRLDALHSFYNQLVGGEPICCDNLSYNYRRNYAHEEISLAYYLSATQHLPRGASAELSELLEFYLQSVSTAMTADSCAVGAATLANKGRCPLTDNLVIDRESIKNTFKVMKSSVVKELSCSCQYTQEVLGSWNENGSIMLIVPGVLGLTCFTHCQSIDIVQKVAACIIKELNESFNFSVYKSLKDHECSSKRRK
uniref:glutaminase n=1 Tax=Phallusia mammillata TaxID=59560 RepID=A0A6F9DD52_9ASCI|nr:putative glutaminase 2 [Phallusia mammillata]